MTTTNHYGEARDMLQRTDRRSATSQHDLAAAQVHAMLAIADEWASPRSVDTSP